MSRPKIAIVHDYLTQRGGAERVVLSMLQTFPGAPVYTALYEPGSTFPDFENHDIRPLWTNRIAALRRHHRMGLPLYPIAFAGLRVDADVVICSSSGFSHGVRTTGRKIVYCYTPPRWLYDQAGSYLAGWPSVVAGAVRATGPVLRRWDKRAAATADAYLTSSTVVRERIQEAYGIDAEVVPPPVPSPVRGEQRPVDGVEPGFVLCVSRLLSYKNVDAVVSAFKNLPGACLVVVGEGPEQARLTRMAGSNVSLLGRVDDAELAWLYANCAGVVSASYEDFGLTAVEAASCGKPVAVLRAGGFLDTVVERETGMFFDGPVGVEVAEALTRMLDHAWDAESMMRGAGSSADFSVALGRCAASAATAR